MGQQRLQQSRKQAGAGALICACRQVNHETPAHTLQRVLTGVSFGGLRSVARLLAAVALQKIHRVDGNCVAADGVVVVHSILLL